jgi:hypothetical protein
MAATNVKVMYPGQIDGTVAEWNPAEYPVRYLAEGDSWFSFGSWKLQSMLTQLRMSRPTALVTLAQPGDTIRRMSDISRNPELDNWLSRRFGAYNWNALLISGGGNDVIDDAGQIIPASPVAQSDAKDSGEYVDRAVLDKTLADVREGYRRIVEMRDRPDSPCPGVPLVTHAYDLVTPRNAPARFLVPLMGPWLYPAMVAARIPESRWNDVADFILGALGECIAGLETELANFHVAPTQGTLKRAQAGTTGDSNDWANEIHPNRKGFRELAKLLAVPLEALT